MGGGDGQDESRASSLFPVSLGLAYEQWLKGLAGHAGRRSSNARHRRRPWGTHGFFWGRALSGPPYKGGPWHFRLSIALVRLLSLFSPPSTGFILVGGHTSLCYPPSHPGQVEVLSERSSCSCGSGMCSWPLPVSACPLEHAMRDLGDGRG